MASWRDQLQPASFRGVAFKVVTAEGGHGRRLASHEYPLRDDPWHEDMGRKFREFSLDAYVLEPDHIGQANALIAACEKLGPGKLIHPWIGQIDVVVTACRVRFTHAEGGMATFGLSFAEAGKPVYPVSEENATGAINKAAATAKTAITGRFLQNFSMDKVSNWLADGASGLLKDAITSLGPIGEGIASGVGKAAAWAKDLNGVLATATQIVRNPTALASRTLGLIDLGNMSGISSLIQTPLSVTSAIAGVSGGPGVFAWQSLLPLTNFGLPYAPDEETTTMRRRNNANTAALGAFVRQAATIEMARAAVVQDFETTQDAAAASDAIQDVVDRELPLAGDEDGQALQEVATVARRVISKKLATLPTMITVTAAEAAVFSVPLPAGSGPVSPRTFAHTPLATVPAITIAYAMYGDTVSQVASRAEQIVSRNRIPHGGFVPGGSPIELISLG